MKGFRINIYSFGNGLEIMWKCSALTIVNVICSGRKGGELASAVHAYTKTGDPYMRSLVQHILSLVSHPILNFLYRWIYDGELEDTYHEVKKYFCFCPGVDLNGRIWFMAYKSHTILAIRPCS